MTLFLLACTDSASDTDTGPAPLAEVYELADDEQFPEGIAFHAGERAFFLSSLTSGGVTRLDADGTESTIHTPASGWMSLGMKIDEASDQLVVCAVSAYGTDDTDSAIWAFDPATGEQTASVMLGTAWAGANCNDVAFHDGAVYVTDRENLNLYRVDLAAGTAELWFADEALAPSVIGMNGIVVTDDAQLLVGKYSPAELYRVPLDDPGSFEQVSLSGDGIGTLPDGFDGIVRIDDRLAIAGHDSSVVLRSDDGWLSATATPIDSPVGLAAMTVAEGRLYGLKGEVVPWVLGTDVDLPFEVRTLEL